MTLSAQIGPALVAAAVTEALSLLRACSQGQALRDSGAPLFCGGHVIKVPCQDMLRDADTKAAVQVDRLPGRVIRD